MPQLTACSKHPFRCKQASAAARTRARLKCVHSTTRGGRGSAAKWRSVAHSRPTPSAASVPLPNSSMMQRDLHFQQRESRKAMREKNGTDHGHSRGGACKRRHPRRSQQAQRTRRGRRAAPQQPQHPGGPAAPAAQQARSAPLSAEAQHGGHLGEVDHEGALRQRRRLAGGHLRVGAGRGGERWRTEGERAHRKPRPRICSNPSLASTPLPPASFQLPP